MLAAPKATRPASFIKKATLSASMPSNRPSLPSLSTNSLAKRVGAVAPSVKTTAAASTMSGVRQKAPPRPPTAARLISVAAPRFNSAPFPPETARRYQQYDHQQYVRRERGEIRQEN